jgi:hypothetical protein
MSPTWIPIIISRVISLLQASSLRERYYTLVNRVELLELAMEDIERINANSSTPNALIAGICTHIRN